MSDLLEARGKVAASLLIGPLWSWEEKKRRKVRDRQIIEKFYIHIGVGWYYTILSLPFFLFFPPLLSPRFPSPLFFALPCHMECWTKVIVIHYGMDLYGAQWYGCVDIIIFHFLHQLSCLPSSPSSPLSSLFSSLFQPWIDSWLREKSTK